MRVAGEVFGELSETLQDPELHAYAERILGELGDLKDAALAKVELPTGLPDFVVRSLPEEGDLSRFRPAFEKFTEVFGVHVFATDDTEDRKVRHAARILAEPPGSLPVTSQSCPWYW